MNDPAVQKGVDLSRFPVNDNPVPVNWRGKVIRVRPILEYDETTGFVDEVVSLCYDGEQRQMIPERGDLMFRYAVLRHYTDAVLPEDFTDINKLCYLTDIYDTVVSHAKKAQIEALRKVVDSVLFGVHE